VNGDFPNESLENAVAEWKQRHQIGDDDPLLASVELWKLLLSHGQPSPTTPDDFKKPLEQIGNLSKTFVKHSGEIIQEIRTIPRVRSDLWAFPYFTVALAAVGALIIGIFIGKFLL
jgi:hypothetical protein